MATIQQIREVLDRFYSPRFNSQSMAFEQLLMGRCEDRKTEEFIRKQIDAMIAKGELPPGRIWTEAWNEFYSNAHMVLECEANEALLLKALGQRNLPFSAENLLGLGTDKKLVASLAKTPKWIADQEQAARDQAAWKQEGITASNEAIEAGELERELLSSWYDANGIRRRDIDPREFAKAQDRVKALTLEQLRAEVAIKRENKRRRGLSKVELAELTRSENAPGAQAHVEAPVAPALVTPPVPIGKLPIPAEYFPPGKLASISWSERLYSLLPAGERQRLIRDYGADQLVYVFNLAKAAKGSR